MLLLHFISKNNCKLKFCLQRQGKSVKLSLFMSYVCWVAPFWRGALLQHIAVWLLCRKSREETLRAIIKRKLDYRPISFELFYCQIKSHQHTTAPPILSKDALVSFCSGCLPAISALAKMHIWDQRFQKDPICFRPLPLICPVIALTLWFTGTQHLLSFR